MNRLSPTEDQLHAYADGQLAADERAQLEAWLAEHPAEAEQVAAWRQQNAALRAAFDPVLGEAVPERLLRAARRTPRWGLPLRLAAGIAWLGIGVAIGYMLRGAPTGGEAARVPLAHSAAVAHVVYTPEVRHPVEVGADQEAHLVQWLSKRLGSPLRVPDLSTQGYALVGGRLLPGDAGPVAQFMYEDGGGRRLTLYVRSDAQENRETAFRFAREGKLAVFYWLDGKLGYALSGEMPREQLLSAAESAYRQLNP